MMYNIHCIEYPSGLLKLISRTFLKTNFRLFQTGFGDYLLKTEDIAIRDSKGALILCSLYTIFGMALIAMSFNLLKDETTRILKTLAVTIGLVSKQEG